MKTVAVESEGLTVEKLIQEASDGEVIFLTKDGETHFALVPADDADQEVCALRSNTEFMELLSYYEQRARTRPRKTLEQIQKEHKIPNLQ